MNATVRGDDFAHFPYLKRIRCILEWSLHLAFAKPAQIAALLVRRAIRVRFSERCKGVRVVLYLRRVTAQDVDGFRLRACDVGLQSRKH